MIPPNRIIPGFLFLCFFLLLHTYSLAFTCSGTSERITAEQLVSQLEVKYGITVFYQEQWFEDAFFSSDLLNQTPDLVIRTMLSGRDLYPVFFDGIIVLLPSDDKAQISIGTEKDQVVIGNPNVFGRFSSARVSGYIFDGTTGETLVGATVYNEDLGIGVSTNIEGFYTTNWTTGDYRIRISYIGYEDAYRNIKIISDGNADFELFSSTTMLDAVIVQARLAGHNLLRTQMSVINLNAKAIKELPGSFGERDIVRSLTLLPGVQSVGEFGTGFNVRGSSVDQNLILIENVPLFNSSHLFGLISVINPDLVESVNLMKAGIPATYGERAASVMDVRLLSSLDNKHVSASGSLGLLNSRLLLKVPVIKNKASVSLGARSSHTDLFLKKIPNDELINSTSGFYDLTGVVNLAVTPFNFITLFGYSSFDRFGIDQENHYQYGNNLLSARWNSIINPKLSSTLVVGLSNYNLQIDETPYINPLIHARVNSSVDYRKINWSLHSNHLKNHSIEGGLALMHYDIAPGTQKPLGESSLKPALDIQKERALEAAVFLKDEITMSEKFSAELGLRFNNYFQLGPFAEYLYDDPEIRSSLNIVDSVIYKQDEIVKTYRALEPRVALRYSINETSSLKASYSRINQFVNLVSNSAVMAPADVWKLSDKYILPLKSDQLAFGYFRNFNDNSIETSVELYYKKLQNVVEYKPGSDIMMNRFISADIVNAEGYNYGLEVYLRKATGRFTGWSSYTYSVSQRRTTSPDPGSQINRNDYFPSDYDRPHNWVLNSTYHFSRRWRMGLTFTYNTGRPVTLPELVYDFQDYRLIYYSDRNKYRLPDYHRLDFSLTMDENLKRYERGKGSWAFSVMNLYGRKNPYTVFYKKEKDRFGDPGSFNLYQLYIIGRAFPTLNYTFSF